MQYIIILKKSKKKYCSPLIFLKKNIKFNSETRLWNKAVKEGREKKNVKHNQEQQQ